MQTVLPAQPPDLHGVHLLTVQLSRAEHIRVMLDLKPSDLNMILRKNPVALVKDVQTIRLRYNALHTVRLRYTDA